MLNKNIYSVFLGFSMIVFSATLLFTHINNIKSAEAAPQPPECVPLPKSFGGMYTEYSDGTKTGNPHNGNNPGCPALSTPTLIGEFMALPAPRTGKVFVCT